MVIKMWILYSTIIYIFVGSVLVLFYIGAAGYPHKFTWEMLIERLSEKENVLWTVGLVVFWFPLLVYLFIRGLIDRLKLR